MSPLGSEGIRDRATDAVSTSDNDSDVFFESKIDCFA